MMLIGFERRRGQCFEQFDFLLPNLIKRTEYPWTISFAPTTATKAIVISSTLNLLLYRDR